MEMLRFSIQACSDRIKHSQRWNEYNTSRSHSLSHWAYLCFILPPDWHERWHQILSDTDACWVHRKHRSFPIILWFLQKVRFEQKGRIWPLTETSQRFETQSQMITRLKVRDTPVFHLHVLQTSCWLSQPCSNTVGLTGRRLNRINDLFTAKLNEEE